MIICYECKIENDIIQFGKEGEPASSVVALKDAVYVKHVPEEEVRAALTKATESTERFDVTLWVHPRYK